MASLFGPKPPDAIPPPNPADLQNRLNSALTRRLQGGGTNADMTGAGAMPTGLPRLPTLTGLTP